MSCTDWTKFADVITNGLVLVTIFGGFAFALIILAKNIGKE